MKEERMGERLRAIDGAILGFFTRMSHAFQRLTGRTNFFLARIMIIVISISLIVAICNYWIPILHRRSYSFEVAIDALVLLIFIWHFHYCKKAEEQVFSGNKTFLFRVPFDGFEKMGLMSFLRLFAASSGIISIIFYSVGGFIGAYDPAGSALFIFRFLDFAFMPVLSAYLYLLAVHPMPPGRSKIYEWIESLASGFWGQTNVQAHS